VGVTAAGARSDPGQDTRERILEAALQAFAERGFDGATTREIAARAGANLGLLQYHFGGKLPLWRAAVDRAFAALRDGLGDVMREAAAADDRDRLRLLIRRYVRFVARNPEFLMIMHQEGKRAGPRTRWLVDRHVKPLYETTVRFVERAQRGGHLPAAISPVHFHYILAGSVGLIFHQAAECRRLTGMDPGDEALIEAHADAVEHLFLGRRREDAS
jgi:AcrR family transcriptional regulator